MCTNSRESNKNGSNEQFSLIKNVSVFLQSNTAFDSKIDDDYSDRFIHMYIVCRLSAYLLGNVFISTGSTLLVTGVIVWLFKARFCLRFWSKNIGIQPRRLECSSNWYSFVPLFVRYSFVCSKRIRYKYQVKENGKIGHFLLTPLFHYVSCTKHLNWTVWWTHICKNVNKIVGWCRH